jgi:hypothetical protein
VNTKAKEKLWATIQSKYDILSDNDFYRAVTTIENHACIPTEIRDAYYQLHMARNNAIKLIHSYDYVTTKRHAVVYVSKEELFKHPKLLMRIDTDLDAKMDSMSANILQLQECTRRADLRASIKAKLLTRSHTFDPKTGSPKYIEKFPMVLK